MPVALPEPGHEDLSLPSAGEVDALGRAIAHAIGPGGRVTDTQRLLMEALFPAMTGFEANLDGPPLDPAGLGAAFAARNVAFRTRILQLMILGALVLRPIPSDVTARVGEYARELSVDDGMLAVAERFAAGSLGLAAVDFTRNGYTATWSAEDAKALHTSRELADAWETAEADRELADRWRSLERLGENTLGWRVTAFYRARGFSYPGLPGSAPPLLAQHDWVHVLADYGTTVESELEVFGFIARANDDLRAFSLLAMVVSLFETGYLRTGAGLFEYSPGHLAREGMAVRLADAMRRGALCPGSIDFLRTDWFSLAECTIDDARAHFGVPAKSPGAVAAGSVGPWEPGGISPFQAEAGARLASAEGRPYDAFGAVPAG